MFYAVMFFYNDFELGISHNFHNWTNTNNIITENGAEALNLYANTKCPASQLIKANTKEELQKEMNQMIQNFKSKEWLDEYLYPCL